MRNYNGVIYCNCYHKLKQQYKFISRDTMIDTERNEGGFGSTNNNMK